MFSRLPSQKVMDRVFYTGCAVSCAWCLCVRDFEYLARFLALWVSMFTFSTILRWLRDTPEGGDGGGGYHPPDPGPGPVHASERDLLADYLAERELQEAGK